MKVPRPIAIGITLATIALLSHSVQAQQTSKKKLSKTQIGFACSHEIRAVRQEQIATFETDFARFNRRPDGPEKVADQRMYSGQRSDVYSPKDDADWIVKRLGHWQFDVEDLEPLRLSVAKLNAAKSAGRASRDDLAALCIATAKLALQEGKPIPASSAPLIDDPKAVGGMYRP